jgi:molecular chaperone DnaK
VSKLQQEAEAHAAEDAKRREEIELRNHADTLAYSAEKTLRENADKVPSDLKTEVEGHVAEVRSALQGTDIEAVRRSVDALNESMQKIGQAVYASAGSSGNGTDGQAPGQGEPQEEGTVEGEFREV